MNGATPGAGAKLPKAGMNENEIVLKCDACKRLFHMPEENFKAGRACPKCGGELRRREKPKGGGLKLELETGEGQKDKIPRSLAEGLKGRYNLIEQIGRGGMGVVFKAEQMGLQRTVALKVLIGGEGASPDMITRFVREAQSAGSLRHPNIVQVHDAGVVEGMHFFSMDYIEGVPLHKLMDGKALSTERALELLVKIAHALHFAHDCKIVHRDLKPANVIVDFEGEPHIMDFGLARDFSHASDLSVSGTLIGTPAYMSPEAARGDIKQVDQRSDIYSLGVILYEMITHTQPFQGNTLYETITNVISAEPRPPRQFNASLGSDLDTICMKAIEKDPANRYQTMAAFANDMDSFLKGEAISARPVGGLERLLRRARKHKALVGVGALVLCVILGLAVMLVMKTSYMQKIDQQLRDPDPQMRLGGVNLLTTELKKRQRESRRKAIVSRLLACVEGDKNVEVRLAAVKALRAAGAESALPEMRKIALSDADERIRKEAIGLIEDLQDGESIDVLSEIALGTGPDSVRLSAIRALGKMKEDEAKRALITIANDPMENRIMRLAAKEALGPFATKKQVAGRFNTGVYALRVVVRQREKIEKIYQKQNARYEAMMDEIDGISNHKPDEPKKPEPPKKKETLQLDELEKALKSRNPDERLQAVFALGVLAEPKTAPWLTDALRDTSVAVSNAAAQALIDMKAIPPEADLKLLMDDSQSHVRANAIRLIGVGGHRDLADNVLLRLGKETDPRVVCACLETLGRLKPDGARLAVRDVLDKAKDPRVKDTAQRVLGELNQ